MSRRREAAELARVLALSTQQTRDIADISPHSLSSGHAGATQDSRDMELKRMQPNTHVATGLSDDEVALFSSRSVEDETNHSRIQSFNPSDVIQNPSPLDSPTQQHGMPAPLVYVRRHPNEIPPDSSKVHTSVQSSEYLSPTQLSAQAAPEPAARLSPKGVQTPHQRTPLQPKAYNQAFALSSPPAEPSSSTKKVSQPTKNTIFVVSDSEEVEIIESTHPTPASKRPKLRPEIILQSTSASRARSRHESPDPLDVIQSGSTSTLPSLERRSEQPGSSANASTSTVAERKSSRVQAAADKKELEKEEKRRLRRERKAREEADRLVGGDQARRIRRQTSNASVSATKPVAHSDAPTRKSRQAPQARRTTVTTVPATNRGPPAESIQEHSAESPAAGPRIDMPSVQPRSPISPAKVAEPALDSEKHKLGTPKSPSPEAQYDRTAQGVGTATMTNLMVDPRRQELVASSSSARQSPGPVGPDGRPQRPDGIRWQTTRNDLSGVLAKFGGARQTGMSKRHRIAPLHAKIGAPAKALPPVPQKPVRRKKGDSSDEEDSEEGADEDENGVRKPKSKVKDIEWYKMED